MDFITKIDIPKSDFRISYHSNLVFIGSCFAENISRRFTERKFSTLANPLGVLYNPLSIENQIKKILASNGAGEHAEQWDRWDCQSALNRDDLTQVAKTSRDFIAKADVVFITLGTAFVYFLKETGKAVANCHREPADLFERRLISVDEAAEALKGIVNQILRSAQNDTGKNTQNDVRIVFTVSPLRHLNDGAHGNNLSKATLHLAIEKVMQEFANTAGANSPTVSYFPSYEIVLDELRDYRFYAEDMTHLTNVAEDYIFERMVDTYCDDTTKANIKQVEKFMKTANHRIVDADSARTAEMAKQQIAKAEELEKQIAGLDLSKEKAYYSSLI